MRRGKYDCGCCVVKSELVFCDNFQNDFNAISLLEDPDLHVSMSVV